MKNNNSIKSIFLAEGEQHVRKALHLLLDYQEGFVITGEAGNPESLMAQVCTQPPDLLLLDWELPGLHHTRLIETVRQYCPQILIVALGIRPEDQVMALARGVDQFILKNLFPEDFLSSLKAIFQQKEEKND